MKLIASASAGHFYSMSVEDQARVAPYIELQTTSGRRASVPTRFSTMTFEKGSGAVERMGYDGTDMK
jgi:hypothetical protein